MNKKDLRGIFIKNDLVSLYFCCFGVFLRKFWLQDFYRDVYFIWSIWIGLVLVGWVYFRKLISCFFRINEQQGFFKYINIR